MKLTRNVAELQFFPVEAPPEYLCIYIIGEFIEKSRGNEYLVVIIDGFTKLVKTVPMKAQSAAQVAK